MLETIDILKLRSTLPQIERGLSVYMTLLNDLHITDVSKDREFQKRYNGHYRMRQRPASYYQIYYEYMEKTKNTSVMFEDILTYLYESTSRMEASFSSKMLALINPDMPVWDKNVLSQLLIKPPAYVQHNKQRQLVKIIQTYQNVINWYNTYLATNNARDVIRVFNEIFPGQNISDTKIIDLVLWSFGARV